MHEIFAWVPPRGCICVWDVQLTNSHMCAAVDIGMRRRRKQPKIAMGEKEAFLHYR